MKTNTAAVPALDRATARKIAAIKRRLDAILADVQDIRFVLPEDRRLGAHDLVEGILKARRGANSFGKTFEELYPAEEGKKGTVYDIIEQQNVEALDRFSR